MSQALPCDISHPIPYLGPNRVWDLKVWTMILGVSRDVGLVATPEEVLIGRVEMGVRQGRV